MNLVPGASRLDVLIEQLTYLESIQSFGCSTEDSRRLEKIEALLLAHFWSKYYSHKLKVAFWEG